MFLQSFIIAHKFSEDAVAAGSHFSSPPTHTLFFFFFSEERKRLDKSRIRILCEYRRFIRISDFCMTRFYFLYLSFLSRLFLYLCQTIVTLFRSLIPNSACMCVRAQATCIMQFHVTSVTVEKPGFFASFSSTPDVNTETLVKEIKIYRYAEKELLGKTFFMKISRDFTISIVKVNFYRLLSEIVGTTSASTIKNRC